MGKKRLTKAQEQFVQYIIKGHTQHEAMLKAYPQRHKWKRQSIDSAASALFRNEMVQARYQELLGQVREEEKKKVLWTREEAIENLKFVVETNRKDLERVSDAYEQELEELMRLVAKDPNNAEYYLKQALKSRKQRRATQTNNRGITEAVAELNKMQGFNEENINLNNTVVFAGEDELEE